MTPPASLQHWQESVRLNVQLALIQVVISRKTGELHLQKDGESSILHIQELSC
jgi:hypothetical protein